ncbi:MAG: PAS domain-containing protein [Acidimicrobiales bacterium]
METTTRARVREDSFTDFHGADFERVVDRLLTPDTVVSSDTTHFDVNDVVAHVIDASGSEIVGTKMFSFIHADDRARVRDELERIFSGESSAEFTRFCLRGRQGQHWRTFDSYAHNVMDDPHVRGTLGRVVTSVNESAGRGHFGS